MDRAILEYMKKKTTEELESIIKEDDKQEYREETFDIISFILEERAGQKIINDVKKPNMINKENQQSDKANTSKQINNLEKGNPKKEINNIPPKRHGLLTFILWLMIFGYSIGAIISIVGLYYESDHSPVLLLILLTLYVSGVFFVYYLLKWEKWAFWGIICVAALLFIIDIVTGNFGVASIKVLLHIGSLYALLLIPKNGVRGWDNLKGGFSVDLKEEKNEDRKSEILMKVKEISITEKYSQLKKLGDLLYDKKLLTEEEFIKEKIKVLNQKVKYDKEISINTKYALLEELGILYKNNIINEEEFKYEKTSIFNN